MQVSARQEHLCASVLLKEIRVNTSGVIISSRRRYCEQMCPLVLSADLFGEICKPKVVSASIDAVEMQDRAAKSPARPSAFLRVWFRWWPKSSARRAGTAAPKNR